MANPTRIVSCNAPIPCSTKVFIGSRRCTSCQPPWPLPRVRTLLSHRCIPVWCSKSYNTVYRSHAIIKTILWYNIDACPMICQPRCGMLVKSETVRCAPINRRRIIWKGVHFRFAARRVVFLIVIWWRHRSNPEHINKGRLWYICDRGLGGFC